MESPRRRFEARKGSVGKMFHSEAEPRAPGPGGCVCERRSADADRKGSENVIHTMKKTLARLLLGAALVPAGFAIAQDGGDAADGMEGAKDAVIVEMQTSMGQIVMELDAEKAPLSTANFLTYVEKGFYDGTIFHRVMPGFMIQGGGFTADMQQKQTDPPIKNEWKNGLKNVRGSVAMARTQIADSATSQFFINVVDNSMLDVARDGAAYAVFGTVVEGMDVVDKIKDVPTTTSGGHQAVPVTPVVIEKVTWKGPQTLDELKARANEMVAKERQEAAAASEKTLAEAIEYVKSMGGDVTKAVKSDTGLWYVDVTEGEGAQPSATNVVRVHYTGWLTNGQKFQSSRDNNQPVEFSLNRVVAGWKEGVSSMKVGGKRFLIVPPHLGYGARSPSPSIPPNSTLVFEVELLDIVS